MPVPAATSFSLPDLRLKRGEDRRLRAGHMWIFSNEVDTGKSPLDCLEPGAVVNVVDAGGRAFGTAMVNPHSLICARLISRKPDVRPDRAWFAGRLRRALEFRQDAYPEPYYRLVFGEGDGLPGLILDRYGDYLVGQLNTAGMDRARAEIEAALVQVLAPRGLLWRNDAPARELEGLRHVVETGFGEVPARIPVIEGALEFEVDPHTGQKTGWYYDQRANRARLAPLVRRGWRVLDAWCYQGAWGVAAAVAGAGDLTLVDRSAPALAAARANAAANAPDIPIHPVQADAESFMNECLERRERFDLIVIDPPPFARRARDVKPALAAYRRINELAIRLMNYGGLLVSCSCSAHVREDRFTDILRRAARHVDRELQILARLEQGPDHPVHPAIPETRYLKGCIARVVPSY